MSTGGATIGFALMGGTGILLLLVGGRYLGRYVRMARSDPVDMGRIGDPSDPVELTGEVAVHDGTSRAPFTGTESVLHEWEVRENRGDSRNSGGWSTLDWGQELHPFVLDDGTGAVLVEAAEASRELVETTTFHIDEGESPPPNIASFLDASDQVSREQVGERKYEERRIDPGDEAYVVGPVRKSGHTFDLPGRVDAVVGVEDPDRAGGLLDWLSPGTFIVANTGEAATRGQMLRKGGLWFVAGLLFLAIPAGVLLLG